MEEWVFEMRERQRQLILLSNTSARWVLTL